MPLAHIDRTLDATPAKPTEIKPLPLKQKLAWALGSVSGNFTVNSVNQLAIPVYNLLLGVDAALLGWALAIPRAIDAITDPLMGILSDNTRSRWGRRKPYIMGGAILTALMAVLLWFPPTSLGSTFLFAYFTMISVVYYIGFTIMGIPHGALGLEMTSDYNERTRVQAWGMVLGLICGLALPWLYKLTLLDIFNGDEMLGVRTIGCGVALIILITGLAPVIFCRENKPTSLGNKANYNILKSLRQAFRIPSFRIVLATQLIALCSTFMVAPCLLYLNIYLLFDGNKSEAATLLGWAGTVQMIGACIGIPINTWLSSKLEKHRAALLCLAIAIIGFSSYKFTLVASQPWLQLISNAFVGFGIQGVWLMCASMIADVCDVDEIENGTRREGLFGSVSGFSQKAALALAGLCSGYIISFSGYSPHVVPTEQVINNILYTFIIIQIVGLLLAMAIISKYRLTRRKMTEIHEQLKSVNEALG